MKRIARFLTWFAIPALAGCISLGAPTPPSHFYLLGAAPAPVPAGPVQGELQLTLVALPAYLDRPQLVTRRNEQELEIAPFERWGEPLATGITRVLAATLRQRLPELVVVAGAESATRAATGRLQVSFDRFEGNQASGQVELAARWQLATPAGAILARGQVELVAPWPERSASSLVEGYDQLLARFGGELARQVALVLIPARAG
ncbi:hypothetical protein JCM30471_27000 [Desulfuromonas carbonis]|uniref:PqiC family protein n=1 Tax=Desulfuromonas sp. DDH964 TaxID=1823759 RepID=UPI00078C3BBC|nr:PqiC family protein [Desulfuromonas sp. DDH964]AMV70893.1 hypothetical protein DBW_0492 [Desulfuromonas sp. DDH964]